MVADAALASGMQDEISFPRGGVRTRDGLKDDGQQHDQGIDDCATRLYVLDRVGLASVEDADAWRATLLEAEAASGCALAGTKREGRGGERYASSRAWMLRAAVLGIGLKGLGEWSYNDCPEKKEGGGRQPTTSLLQGDSEIAEIG
ncbi:hypothetical protein COCMIDRAFT_28692 [Bipolaris oryzae ATCC 44560]|uniref:Uncharacterized protein n=1 Tax=Bipolaris oryzae ATCC 44560 TaxID=930090 RepID=W6Z589_COCMI|nr:uncharacterized protein COCMIDRAFT_28692 [Bipolaris oryzae ATCC 44560]EUC42724.1 hypothetical protein COCMIDRAFT_28692 [Bipolaris oryzae ATCC 44560]